MKDWPATKITMTPVDKLKPFEGNSRTHSEDQVQEIANSMKEFGFTMPILIDESLTIIAGHGRLMAAQLLDYTEVPTMTATGWSEAQMRAYVIADNKLTENAGWNLEKLRTEFSFLQGSDFTLGLTGFSALEIGSLFREDREPYSRKIEAPLYEPKGERPAPSELVDRSKTEKLLTKIDKAKIPDEVADFLRFAAERHAVFNFEGIAEFYAQADKKTQRLMEESALVIIDFDKAIENGFVRTSKALGKIADGDKE